MKKIFVILSLFLVNLLFAQTAEISCNSAGEDCSKHNPEVEITYVVNINNSGQSPAWAINSASWVASPTGQVSDSPLTSSTGSGIQFTTKWKNTENAINSTTNPRKVAVSAVVSRTERINNRDVVVTKTITAEKIITVKHIAPITSASISSGSPNFVSSSGSSVQIPCGTASFTVSVPTPFTDPNQPVTYNWQLPAGWSGSSNSNSITIFPNAGSGGTLDVSARRTDGNFERQFSINFTRPTAQFPTLQNSLNQPICIGSSKLFDASSVNATSYSWSASGSIMFHPQQGKVYR